MTDHLPVPDNTTHFPAQAIRITRSLLNDVIAHLDAALPVEGCGVLGGSRRADGSVIAERFYPGTNVLHSPTRFRMADREVIDALVDMRQAGLELVGIVHSHPASPPTLSPTDLNEAHYRNIALLIAGFGSGIPEVRAWTVPPGPAAEPVEIRLEVGRIG